MKIAIAGGNHPDTLERNIYVTLLSMGHQAVLCDDIVWLDSPSLPMRYGGVFLSRIPQLELYRSQRVADQVVKYAPDVFIACWRWLRPEAVERIHQVGIRTVMLYPDSIANLDRQYILQSPYDILIFKEPYAVRTFRDKLGLPVHYLPEACNPMWHKPVALTDSDRSTYGCDLTTAGNMYPYRTKMFEIFDGYNMKLWGPAWPAWNRSKIRKYYMGRPVYEMEKAKAFSAAKIVLNVLYYAEIEGVNCRVFEAAGCGAFQVADWKPTLPELFEPDREIVTFETREELKDKVDYYLQHPDQRHRIALAGQRRAHREHTYAQRLQQIFQLVMRT